MHIGIIQYKNKIIYIDLKDNKIYGYYYNKKGKQTVSSNTILSLINSLFERENETFVTTENEYKIYINKETGYKHFYKNNQQDILKFFLENGKNAIMYDNENPSIVKKVKEFYNKHKSVRFLLNFVVIYSTLMATDIVDKVYTASETLAESQGLELSFIEENYDCYFDYHQLCQSIQDSLSLSTEEKESLYNEDLFNDICATPMTIDRIKDLEEKITDVEIVPFTEQDYQDQQQKKEENEFYTVGYYSPLEPNILHVDENRSPDEIEDTKYHEFIHLLQDNNKYYYIREAVAEIVSNEYFGAPLNSYQEAGKRIKALMETIGSNSIWNICFSGDDSKLINLLKENLSEEEYQSFCKILETSPANLDSEKREELNKNFDDILSILYNNMYSSSIEEDEVIKKIYESETGEIFGVERNYFRDCNLEDNKIIKERHLLTDAIEENAIDIDFYKKNRREITEQEYQIKQIQGEEVEKEFYIYDNPETSDYVYQEYSKCFDPEHFDPVELEEKEKEWADLGYGEFEYFSIELSPIQIEEISSLRQQGASITYNINYISPDYSSANILYSRDKENGTEIPVVYFQKEVKLDNFKSNNRSLTQTIETSKSFK